MDKAVVFELKGLWFKSCLRTTFFFPFFWKNHEVGLFSQVGNKLDFEKLKFQVQMNEFYFYKEIMYFTRKKEKKKILADQGFELGTFRSKCHSQYH